MKLIINNKYLARVIEGCNSISIIILFVSFIVAFSGPLKTTFFYAAVRYLIFSHQFYLFLLFFGVDLEYSIAMPIIVSMYLISSVIPGFVLFDWLVKGSVAVTLFRLFGVDDIIILSITASMWILNFAFPAIIGSFYVLTFKSSTLVYSESKLRE